MSLYDKVDASNYLFSIQKSLLQRSGIQRFPKNAEVVDALKVKDVYNIKSKNRIYLLERIENYENSEILLYLATTANLETNHFQTKEI